MQQYTDGVSGNGGGRPEYTRPEFSGIGVTGIGDTADTAPNQDVGVERIAAVYAEAFLSSSAAMCGDTNNSDTNSERVAALVGELEEFVADVLNTYPKYEKILASGLISEEEKCELLDRAFGGGASGNGAMSRLVLNFLKVLARHGRLDCIRPVVRGVRSQYERSLGLVRVTVTTPTPVSDDLARRLAAEIAPLAGGDPILETRVDPELIGGIVVRVGDTIYDASIQTQLKNLREQLVQRSSHEIQSRRDRFRHPE